MVDVGVYSGVSGVCVQWGQSGGCVCAYTVGCVSAVGSVVEEEVCSGVSGVCVCRRSQWCVQGSVVRVQWGQWGVCVYRD